MKKRLNVHGLSATAPRPTKVAAMLLASVIAVPVLLLLNLIEWLFF